MDRRTFLKCGGSLGILIVPGVADYVLAAGPVPSFDGKALFITEDPKLLALAEDIFNKCILDKIKPPEGPLKHRWLHCGNGDAFYGQWIWDAMFVVDLLALVPDSKDAIRDVFQNYWDFQVSWNKAMPDYAHDMVANSFWVKKGGWPMGIQFSQIPILAWGLERVYRRNGDKELLRQGLLPLERFHEWYWRERDVTNVGLIAVGSYSGIVQDARYETFDYECNMDGLKMTVHPTRKGEKEGAWYGDICVPGNTAYLVMAERSLVRLAEIMGDNEMAMRRKARIDKAVEAMRKHMWDEESGLFLSVNRDSLEKIPVGTIGSWIPLWAGVPTEAMARRMADVLQTEQWATPLPIPTVNRKDNRWRSNSYWRGDVWPAPNYQIASGLVQYGYKELAASIADKTIANALINGVSEHYDAISGKPLGVPYIGMCCTLLTMMLDGMTKDHVMRLSG